MSLYLYQKKKLLRLSLWQTQEFIELFIKIMIPIFAITY
jgi:hypothetical protein